MTTRNFWMVAEVDGKAEPIATGPRAADGGMTITLYARHEGESKRAVALQCSASVGGLLHIMIDTPAGVIDTLTFNR